jgi:hypothetical protein
MGAIRHQRRRARPVHRRIGLSTRRISRNPAVGSGQSCMGLTASALSKLSGAKGSLSA